MYPVEIRSASTLREFEAMYAQRWTVLRHPLKMECSLQPNQPLDSLEQTAYHLIAVCNQAIVGSARLCHLTPTLGSLSYVAVSIEFQRQGVGTRLVQALLDQARLDGLSQVRVMARADTISFYERFDFRAQGDVIYYLGIAHQFMLCQLSSAASISSSTP
ncbi:GNAT family N-acetyltransferase [Alkalinema sp. FACHB-956]|uniref:GNAT family N-acetyltransferase n=1 Tax=Alkalinema sp. FACHB-956 TaxID=2692768 RepID=UPI0016833FAD|nr:GNAT family N-acetyltransferase [Alkalinema sp. FACHB-956]MBD2329637.1 GNAT family N-acetyltransferase [Alkalinema sp. FACHB-956]